MKYEKEYRLTSNKKAFVKLCRQKYKKIKPESFDRIFYKLRKKLGLQNSDVIVKEGNIYPGKIIEKMTPVQEVEVIGEIEPQEPHQQKLLNLIDMLKYNTPLSKVNLRKHGFTVGEITWIKNRLKVV